MLLPLKLRGTKGVIPTGITLLFCRFLPLKVRGTKGVIPITLADFGPTCRDEAISGRLGLVGLLGLLGLSGLASRRLFIESSASIELPVA